MSKLYVSKNRKLLEENGHAFYALAADHTLKRLIYVASLLPKKALEARLKTFDSDLVYSDSYLEIEKGISYISQDALHLITDKSISEFCITSALALCINGIEILNHIAPSIPTTLEFITEGYKGGCFIFDESPAVTFDAETTCYLMHAFAELHRFDRNFTATCYSFKDVIKIPVNIENSKAYKRGGDSRGEKYREYFAELKKYAESIWIEKKLSYDKIAQEFDKTKIGWEIINTLDSTPERSSIQKHLSSLKKQLKESGKIPNKR